MSISTTSGDLIAYDNMRVPYYYNPNSVEFDEPGQYTDEQFEQDLEAVTREIYGENNRQYLSYKQLDNLFLALKERKRPSDPKTKLFYDKIMRLISDNCQKEWFLEHGHFIIPPFKENNQADTIILYGGPGAGKSWWIGDYCIEFMKIFPNRPIYLYSYKDTDPSLDRIKNKNGLPAIQRILIDDSWLIDNIEDTGLPRVEEVYDSLNIFDDIIGIGSKKLLDTVNKFRDNCIRIGRDKGVYVICSNHIIKGRNDTNIPNNLCKAFVVFPKKLNKKHLHDLLVNLNYDEHEIERISKCEKWVYCRRDPKYFINEYNIVLM
jgi:hypothetical protein